MRLQSSFALAALIACAACGSTGTDGDVAELRLEAEATDYVVFSQLTGEAPSQLSFTADIANNTAQAVSGLSLYYYVDEAAHAPLQAVVDWSPIPVTVSKVDIEGSIKAIVFRVDGPVPAGSVLSLPIRIHTTNWSAANFADDFSGQGLLSERVLNTHTGLYLGNELVFGTGSDADLSITPPGGETDRIEISSQLVQQFDTQLTFKLWVKNVGANNVTDIQALFVRNPSGQTAPTVAAIDWASCAASARVESVSAEREEVVFDLQSTVLVPQSECELHVRLYASNWSPLNFSNDYSVEGLGSNRSLNPFIAGFVGGTQVFGHGVSTSGWVTIGTQEDFAGLEESFPKLPLGVSPNGTRYVYYTTAEGEPRVSRFVDGWESVTTAGLEAFDANARIGFIGESPVLHNLDEVRRLSDSTWELIASPADLGVERIDAITLTSNGDVYAAIPVDGRAQLFVATTETDWAAVGSDIAPPQHAQARPLFLAASPNDKLYMIWVDQGSFQGTLYLSSFDGSTWQNVTEEGVSFAEWGGSPRYLSITQDEQPFFELALGGLRSTFFHSYTVEGGNLHMFSTWGIGPNSPSCQHPVGLFVDQEGNAFRSSNDTVDGVRNYYMERFNFASGTWELQADSLQASTYLNSTSFYCEHTLASSPAGELSVFTSEGVVATFVEE